MGGLVLELSVILSSFGQCQVFEPGRQVTDLSAAPFVKRELALIKVRCDASQRRELSDLAAIFHGSICDVSLTTVTLEMQGKETKMAALQGLLAPYGMLKPHPRYARLNVSVHETKNLVMHCLLKPSACSPHSLAHRPRVCGKSKTRVLPALYVTKKEWLTACP